MHIANCFNVVEFVITPDSVENLS